MKYGTSFATTTPFPSLTRANLATRSMASWAVSDVGMIASSRRYRGGLKKCVPRPRARNSGERSSTMLRIGMPDVFVETIASDETTPSFHEYRSEEHTSEL